jgi:hypothetical protein
MRRASRGEGFYTLSYLDVLAAVLTVHKAVTDAPQSGIAAASMMPPRSSWSRWGRWCGKTPVADRPEFSVIAMC